MLAHQCSRTTYGKRDLGINVLSIHSKIATGWAEVERPVESKCDEGVGIATEEVDSGDGLPCSGRENKV